MWRQAFPVKVGFHQGSALSPFLFLVIIDTLTYELSIREELWELIFADDLIIITNSEEELQEMLLAWKRSLERKGLKVNIGKTEIVIDRRERHEQEGGSIVDVIFKPESVFAATEGETIKVIWFTNFTGEIDRVEVTTNNTFNSEVTYFSQPMPYAADTPNEVNATLLDGDITLYGEFNITALFVGFNTIYLHFFDRDNNTIDTIEKEQKVFLKGQSLTDAFGYGGAVIQAFLYFFMGATLDLQIVRQIVVRPVGPILGLICQYGFMPSIAYGLGLLIFPDDFNLRLGLFLNGCCPGGGQSNMWTHLLGGSLDLSIMMTTASTLAAFGTVPLWVLLVGPTIAAEGHFVIPFFDLVVTVIGLIFPCVVGIISQIVCPKVTIYAKKVLTPFSIVILTYTFSFGVYAYFYLFSIMTWKSIIAGLLLPISGYTIGTLMAKVCCLQWKEAIAVGIETGVQNTMLSIIILTVAIEKPTANIAAVVPGTNTLFTPVPLLIIYIIKKIYERVQGVNTLEVTTFNTDMKETPTKSVELQHNGQVITNFNEKHQLDTEGGITNPAADLRDTA
ncbi:ileal sodium/bile acid cotransporter-like [Palaemon carinicauda]|uniref:ileal sodium/bile acid cotransporter-like n=1 Tax=Palaemon carinicauda TaxID=392227 RepID=UPI0035B58D2B